MSLGDNAEERGVTTMRLLIYVTCVTSDCSVVISNNKDTYATESVLAFQLTHHKSSQYVLVSYTSSWCTTG